MSFWTSRVMRKLRPGVAAILSQTEPYLNAWGEFAADDFHPNEIGYRDWCDAFAEAVGLPVA